MKKELLYLRIAGALEKQIRNHVLKTGDRLPSLRTVCREYGVSMNTATQAYVELERRGLIASRPQSGFFVNTFVKRKMAIPATSHPQTSIQPGDTEALIGKVYHSLNDPAITRRTRRQPVAHCKTE